MKKLIIACAAVLVLGLGLTTVGHVLGGQFYSVYYNGALHPFSDAAQNFSDKFVNINDHLVTADDDDDSDFDTDWVQDYLETRKASMKDYDLPMQALDHITDIELTLKGGDFEIGAGSDFALEGDFSVTESKFGNHKWSLEIWANSGTVELVLPPCRELRYEDIDIFCRQSANLAITTSIDADDIKISGENGTVSTRELVADEIELYAGNGSITAELGDKEAAYHVQARTNGGPVKLNGKVLAQADESATRDVIYDNRAEEAPLEVQATVSGSGQISLTSADKPDNSAAHA